MNEPATPTFESVLEDALKLSEEDREILALRLADEIEPTFSNLDSAEWQAELAVRIDEVRSGRAGLLSWDEARREIFGAPT